MRVLAALALLGAGCAAERGQSVIVVTVDGTRWQEIFGGADAELIKDPKVSKDTVDEFWRPTVEERRRALMPFVWGTMAEQGQLLGNANVGSQVLVTNRYRISYPGYHELLSGFASETIDSNKKVPNPDPTVFEWLVRRPGFKDSVAAFCCWDVFPFILNRERCGFPIDIGEPASPPSLLHRLSAEVQPPWHGSVYDAFVYHAGVEYLREKKPKVLYLAFGEPDEWAHLGDYNNYLDSIKRVDGWLRELWELVQSLPEYRGLTSLIVTCDHGRGDSATEWRSHNPRVHGAGYIWVAAIGPDVPPLGVWAEHEPFMQAQVAATIAALVGEAFPLPNVAPPLPILRPAARR
jgi:hypothetical protein